MKTHPAAPAPAAPSGPDALLLRAPSSRPPGLRVCAALLMAAAALSISSTAAARAAEIHPATAQSKPRQAPPPRSVPKIYEPDNIACQGETIETAYRRNLAPWAGQPEPVLARLRTLQGELTRSSLSRCVSKGLMTAEQARDVERRLSLPEALPGPPTQSTSTSRP